MELIKRIFDFHLSCQQGMLFSEYIPFEYGVAVFSDLIDDNYCNFAAFYPNKSQGDFAGSWEGIRKMFAKREKVPSIYAISGTELYNAFQGSSSTLFRKSYEDVWMVFKDFDKLKGCEGVEGIEVRKILGEDDKNIFVETFNKAFGGDIEGDPYANLPDCYAKALLQSFDNYSKVNPDFVVQHYITWDGELPVGVGSYISQGDMAEVCSLGVIPAYRQKGVGKAIVARRIIDLTEMGVKTIFLGTEAGSNVEAFDKRMGYEAIATGACFEEIGS